MGVAVLETILSTFNVITGLIGPYVIWYLPNKRLDMIKTRFQVPFSEIQMECIWFLSGSKFDTTWHRISVFFTEGIP